MFDLNNVFWKEVKDRLYHLAMVDMSTYNEKTGECRVDFIDDFSAYSIRGKLNITDNDTIIEISDDEKLYLNN